MRNLVKSLAFTRPFIGFEPLLIEGMEPALQCANIVKQTMLGPPFAWRWNRSQITFKTTAPQPTAVPAILSQAEYNFTVNDFGFVERMTITDSNGDVKPLANWIELGVTSAVTRPTAAAIQNDDNDGNITLRLNNIPDQVYTITIQYQRKAVPFLSVASTWFPIPDEMAYVYDWGFLSMAAFVAKDRGLATWAAPKFTAHLLAAQDGLSELQRNLFMGNWLATMQQLERSQLFTQIATTGRAG